MDQTLDTALATLVELKDNCKTPQDPDKPHKCLKKIFGKEYKAVADDFYPNFGYNQALYEAGWLRQIKGNQSK